MQDERFGNQLAGPAHAADTVISPTITPSTAAYKRPERSRYVAIGQTSAAAGAAGVRTAHPTAPQTAQADIVVTERVANTSSQPRPVRRKRLLTGVVAAAFLLVGGGTAMALNDNGSDTPAQAGPVTEIPAPSRQIEKTDTSTSAGTTAPAATDAAGTGGVLGESTGPAQTSGSYARPSAPVRTAPRTGTTAPAITPPTPVSPTPPADPGTGTPAGDTGTPGAGDQSGESGSTGDGGTGNDGDGQTPGGTSGEPTGGDTRQDVGMPTDVGGAE